MIDLETMLALFQGVPYWAAALLLFIGAYGEYVVPIVPGDVMVLAGAVLIAVFGWDVAPIFAVITLGTVLGASTAWQAGRWLDESGRMRTLAPRRRRAIERVLATFERYGAVVLVFNRLFPGIRGFFFVAAGVVRIPLWRVAAYAAVGGTAWNALLVALGLVLGHNLEALQAVLDRVGWVIGPVAVSLVAYAVWKAVAEARAEEATEG